LHAIGTDSIPIDNASRGRLRAWKHTTLQRYRRVAQAFQTEAFDALIKDFYSKRGRGQQRALAKLKNILKEARFVQARLDNPPHARRLIERTLIQKAIDEMAPEIEARAKDIELPTDLADRIKQTLAEHAALSWDQATCEILDEILE
jgi:hypothetical protein